MNAKRVFGIGQGAFGVTLLAFPRPIAERAAGKGTPPPSWLVRVLGLRLLGQGGWLAAHPSEDVLVLGTVVDAVHGSTMAAAAVASRSHRRSASVAAAVALVSIAIGVSMRG